MSNIIFQAGNERRVGYGVDGSLQALRELSQASPKSSLLVEGYQGIVQIPITAILYSVDSTLVEVDGWVEWSIRLLAPRAHVEQFAQYLLSQLGMLPCSAADRPQDYTLSIVASIQMIQSTSDSEVYVIKPFTNQSY